MVNGKMIALHDSQLFDKGDIIEFKNGAVKWPKYNDEFIGSWESIEETSVLFEEPYPLALCEITDSVNLIDYIRPGMLIELAGSTNTYGVVPTEKGLVLVAKGWTRCELENARIPLSDFSVNGVLKAHEGVYITCVLSILSDLDKRATRRTLYGKKMPKASRIKESYNV